MSTPTRLPRFRNSNQKYTDVEIKVTDQFVIDGFVLRIVEGAVCRHNSVRQQVQAVNADAGVHRTYDNADRIRDSLEKDTPAIRPVSPKPDQSARLVSLQRIGGLHHRYDWQQAA